MNVMFPPRKYHQNQPTRSPNSRTFLVPLTYVRQKMQISECNWVSPRFVTKCQMEEKWSDGFLRGEILGHLPYDIFYVLQGITG